MQADRERQFTGEHVAGSEQHAEDSDVDCAQPRRVLIRGMRQAEEGCCNQNRYDGSPPCSTESLPQVLDGVSAVRRLLTEGHGRSRDDPDQDRGHKGLAGRSRGKAARDPHPAHGQLDGEHPEQKQRAQHQSEGELGPPPPAEVEAVVADPAVIEYATRQQQHGGDQEREDERSNQALIEVWEAPGQSCSHATLYRGHDEQHHEKDKQAPPGSEAAFPRIPERMCDCAHVDPLVYTCQILLRTAAASQTPRPAVVPVATGSTPGWGG
jgi:hypothetical protein